MIPGQDTPKVNAVQVNKKLYSGYIIMIPIKIKENASICIASHLGKVLKSI